MTAMSDVRSAVVRTARELLEETGVATLSMREVARRAGVTHQAPYHYFTDRETILAEVVTEGFVELEAALRAANERYPAHGARAATLAAGTAYVGFALAHPGLFRIMFRTDICDPARFDNVRESGTRAFAQIVELVELIYGADADAPTSTVFWAQLHGLALLTIDGPLGVALTSPGQRDGFLRAASERFADLVLPAPRDAPGDGRPGG